MAAASALRPRIISTNKCGGLASHHPDRCQRYRSRYQCSRAEAAVTIPDERSHPRLRKPCYRLLPPLLDELPPSLFELRRTGRRTSRLFRNDEVASSGATNQPDGQITHFLSSPPLKNISLPPSGKTPLHLRVSRFTRRGVGHRRERWAGCGGRGSVGHELKSQGGSPVSDDGMQTNGAEAYGKTVWSWHPLLVSSCRWRHRSDRIE